MSFLRDSGYGALAGALSDEPQYGGYVNAQEGTAPQGAVRPRPGITTGAELGDLPGPRPAASTFPDEASAKAALERDFGVKVKNGSKSWTQEEMSRVHETFSKMSAADRDKLKGLDLIRDRQAPPEVQAEGGGKVAGLYSPNVDTKNGARVKPGSISLYDGAFPTGVSNDASRRVSMHVIGHEAGHAVEGKKRDDALATLNSKGDALNSANDAVRKNLGVDNANREAANKTSQAGPQTGASNAFYAVQNAQVDMNNACSDMSNADTPTQLAAAENRMKAAEARRDAALQKLPIDDPNAAQAQEMALKGHAWKSTAKATGESRITAAGAARDYKTAQAATNAVSSGPAHESKELTSFKAFRAATREKPISDYGATAPEEDYAECYALYRRDPKTMQAEFPDAFRWMKANHP
jgi:hypothetical protein